jgi:DNA repair exonuclease SbcCD ATPase subunit
MRIKRLEIENILSIETATIDFPDIGLMLVDGWNHDTESANGAGKSSIFTALSWGLFGEYPRGVSVTGIVRTGTRKSRVVVEVELSNECTIRVARCRPTQNQFFNNDIEITEAEFKQRLNVTYEQFLLAQYFAQGLGQRFLDLNDTGRKDLILTLMRAQNFANAKFILDAKIKAGDNKLNELTTRSVAATSRMEAYRESLVDESELLTREAELKDSIRAHLDAVKKIELPSTDNVVHIKGLLADYYSMLEEILAQRGEVKTLMQNLKDLDKQKPPEDHHDYSCPSCESILDEVGGELVKHDSNSHVLKVAAWLDRKQTNRDVLVGKIDSLNAHLSKESHIRASIEDCETRLQDIKNANSTVLSRYAELKTRVDERVKELEGVKIDIARNRDLLNKIMLLDEEVKAISIDISNLSVSLDTMKTASQTLSNTGIPAYIMDSVVDAFNDKVQQYLQYIWPQVTYSLNTFRESKSGAVTAKMSDSLTIDGQPYSLGALSGGERKCLSLAIDFAILDVISQYTGATLSPIILDEPFDHLDASNRARTINLLRELSKDRLIIVVDHAAESQALFDQTITVSKRSGISSVA